MGTGLFGKLVAKRDFIAVDLPPGFLQKWEPWLQGAVTGANLTLGVKWQNAFFTAPIWRFWLGREVFGTPALGVLMPSVDGVGRQFPLCLVAPAPEGHSFRPLIQDAQAGWFHEAEDLLLSTLDDGVPFEATLQRLKAFRAPDSIFNPDLPEGVAAIQGGLISVTTDPAQPELALRLLQYARLTRDEPALSVWWTIGGEDYPPTSFAVSGLPDPTLFLRMLTSPVRPQPVAVPPPLPEAPAVETPQPAASLIPDPAAPAKTEVDEKADNEPKKASPSPSTSPDASPSLDESAKATMAPDQAAGEVASAATEAKANALPPSQALPPAQPWPPANS
jgi:type VI secretion system protein ImpM